MMDNGSANQVTIGARVKPVLDLQGLQFRDLNGNGVLDPYEDWRLSAAERAADLVSRMTPEEKIGLMVICSRTMGISQPDPELTSHGGALDEQYQESTTIRTTPPACRWRARRSRSPTCTCGTSSCGRHRRARLIATWINAMNEVAEGTRLGIPVLVAANSKNELGGFKLGSTPNDQDFTQWPGTLGLAATGDLDLIAGFAGKSRAEWVACGLRKGYMYMADTVTDPRWYRSNGTLGEDPEFIAAAIGTIVRGFQGENGLERDGVALTTKHFPGGGARENGLDPHYAEGQANVYPTPGSLQKYHLPPFQAAIDAGTASVMPYYAMPSGAEVGHAAATALPVRAGRFRLQHRGAGPADVDGASRLRQLRLRDLVQDGLGGGGPQRARAGGQGGDGGHRHVRRHQRRRLDP